MLAPKKRSGRVQQRPRAVPTPPRTFPRRRRPCCYDSSKKNRRVRNLSEIIIASVLSRYAAFVPPSRPPCLPSVFADCGNRVQRVGPEVWSTWLPKYRPSGDQVSTRSVTKYDASRHQVARPASPFYSSTWASFTRPFSWISTLSAKGPPLNEHPRKFIYQS